MEWRGSGHGICCVFARGRERSIPVGISRPHTNDRNGKSGKTSAAEKQEREARGEILCREFARLRARSIPMGISCSAVSATVKTEIAWRERETVRKRARDLLRICAGEGEIEMRKSKRNREAKRRESRERETRSEILCRELARLRARSISVGISCSQTNGGMPQRNKD